MAVELYGMVGHRPGDSDGPRGVGDAPIDLEYLKRFAQAHEDGGFDRVLVGYGTSGPDGFGLIGYMAAHTERLGFLLAHRPGFVSPTLAARKIATLDQLTGGRLAIHFITARDNATAGDGDFLPKEDRYRRTDEYITVLKKMWTSETPFDHHGEFYRVEGGFSSIKPVTKPYVPLSFGGSSQIAKEIAARQADTWAFYGEPLQSVREQAAEIQALAAEHGRSINVHVSVRVILGATEEKAWERAHAIAERVRVARGGKAPGAASLGARRLLDAAAQGDVLDKRLFMGVTRYSADAGNSSALVGTPDQVAESMLDYVDAGATRILIRGFEPLQDAIDYGRDLLPIVRAELRRREQRQAVAAAT